MRKGFLFISILFISISVKSQNWNPEFVKSLQEYYFIPVEFENFREWIAGIENDSSIIFKKKAFTIENDSIYLEFNIMKPEIPSPFKNSKLSAQVFGRTQQFNNLSKLKKTSNSISIVQLPPKNVTTIQIFAILTFDSTSEGKLLAANTQKILEEKFAVFFQKKIDLKLNKKHPKVVRSVRFTRKNEVVSSFSIWNSTFHDRNQVALSLLYELKDKNIENKYR